MTGQTNLKAVFSSLVISCDEIEYGFATVKLDSDIEMQNVLGTFQESEGITIIATKDFLDTRELQYEGLFARLTIDVHTSLELVGLTAALASKLNSRGIPANVMAAYFHDHIFVPYELRTLAASALNELKCSI